MAEKKIEVHRFPGFTDDTCPREFDLDGKTVEILETVENWEEEEKGTATRHFFKVKGDDEQLYTIFFDKKRNGWFCS